MASSRNNKSSGLRILWIPGRRKHNSKGRYESTNKHITYNTSPQKKNQPWTLGGNKSHKDFIEAEPDTTLLDGPSVSGLSPLAACSMTTAASAATTNTQAANQDGVKISTSDAPTTPNSSSSTALLVSLPNSPEPTLTNTTTTVVATTTTSTSNITGETAKMPAAKLISPHTVTTTTVAEIIEANRFAVFNQNGGEDNDAYDLPTPPKDDLNWRSNLRINTSGDTTNSIATVSSVSPNSDAKSSTSSPVKKKSQRNHNNNHQNDVNSIESMSEGDQVPDLDWIDELVLEHQANEMLRKTSKHKKKKQHTTVKELDQLDGVTNKNKLTKAEPEKKEKIVEEEDDKIVKCLYFTLMCCECSIS